MHIQQIGYVLIIGMSTNNNVFIRKYKWVFWGIIILMFLNELASFFDNFVFKYLIDKANLFSKDLLSAEL